MYAPRLAIVMPCYNEQEVLPQTFAKLLSLLEKWAAQDLIAANSYLLCVDDGSRDRTWPIISEYHRQDIRVKGVKLAHNRGQQCALLAGLHTAMDRCDICITIDADLQDDPGVMAQMIEQYNGGCEVVFGVRSSRHTDSWFKRTAAQSFYKLQNAMGIKTVYNHADFRLMSNRALHLLDEYGESNLYLRGIIPQIGLKTAIVEYPRSARTAGETKYPLSKQIALSIDGITSFTAKPMRYIFMIGLVLMVIDVAVAIWALFAYISHTAVSGWTSLILSVWFLGSLILMGLGILGEYIGKIYVEVKHRPRFAVETELFD
ncbi:MAG: glycosyltransferase family 2 protein [Muribaculaceae bacterium]